MAKSVKGSFLVDVYACRVHVFVGDKLKQAINYRLRKDEDSIDFDPAGYTLCNNDSISHYYLYFSTDHVDVNTINHEKSHVIDFILKDRCIKQNGEQRAYLDGLVSAKLDTFFKRRKIKVKSSPIPAH
jgi:hypothetical protein